MDHISTFYYTSKAKADETSEKWKTHFFKMCLWSTVEPSCENGCTLLYIDVYRSHFLLPLLPDSVIQAAHSTVYPLSNRIQSTLLPVKGTIKTDFSCFFCNPPSFNQFLFNKNKRLFISSEGFPTLDKTP